MTTIVQQKRIEAVNSFINEDEERQKYLDKENINFHKYHLKCNSCSWNVSYKESSGFLDITQDVVFCPVCRDGKINSSKYF